MLFLVFHIGDERYALPAKSVVEVLPMAALKRVRHAPKSVAGLLNYRGVSVPAVDLSDLTLGRPAAEKMSTRIVIVRCSSAESKERYLGLIAEAATGILRVQSEDFGKQGAGIRGLPYLGPLLTDEFGSIQLLYEQHLLSEPVRQRLFGEELPLLPENHLQPAS